MKLVQRLMMEAWMVEVQDGRLEAHPLVALHTQRFAEDRSEGQVHSQAEVEVRMKRMWQMVVEVVVAMLVVPMSVLVVDLHTAAAVEADRMDHAAAAVGHSYLPLVVDNDTTSLPM